MPFGFWLSLAMLLTLAVTFWRGKAADQKQRHSPAADYDPESPYHRGIAERLRHIRGEDGQ